MVNLMPTTQAKNNVIFAPHIDDEMIGCWRLLNEKSVSRVYYFNDLTAQRRCEAIDVGQYYDFEPIFVFPNTVIELEWEDILWLPNIKDAHPHHKAVNYRGKKYPNRKSYYSIDMNVEFDVLTETEQIKKREALSMYPSQSKLLESDDKYWLFESKLARDWSVASKYDLGDVTIWITGGFFSHQFVEDTYRENPEFNRFVTFFPMCRVELQHDTAKFIFEP